MGAFLAYKKHSGVDITLKCVIIYLTTQWR